MFSLLPVLPVQKRASYRVAAMRSNSFVDFIQQQQKQEQRQQHMHEMSRQGTTANAWLDALGNSRDDEAEAEENEEAFRGIVSSF